MLDDAWELRMERAALQGAIDRTRTLKPFVLEMLADAVADAARDFEFPDLQEMLADAIRQLDATEAELAAKNVWSHGARE